MTFTMLRQGRPIAVPPPGRAERFLASQESSGGGSAGERRAVIGSPQTVASELREVVGAYGAEEAIIVCITYEHEARRHSYELLAEAFGL
jgi:alkanesulfonate monooxygenase SsuD/methylene tetrahydromethanopterin reductase-like flavin-dependent oxidoreductase (luciferase family)